MTAFASNSATDRSIRQPHEIGVINIREFLAIFLLTALVFFSPPLFFIERYSLTSINKPIILALILALAMLFLHRSTISRTVAQLGFLQLVQASALLVLPFAHMTFGYGLDVGYFSVAFQILAGLALFLVLASASRIRLFAVFWVNLHLVIGACGLLVFVGGVVFNLAPIGTFLDRPYYDFGLAYTNVFYQVGNIKLIRIAGFYNEPGTFAFYMTFSLLLARIFGMARWKEFLLIALGLSSLSMAFFVVTLIWLGLSADRKYLTFLLLIFAGLVLTVERLDPEVRDLAYSVTVGRFNLAKSEDRLLKGDNRTAIMKQNYQAFVDAPIIGHGLHYEDYIAGVYGASFIGNPVAPLARNGIFGAILMNLHVFALFLILLATKRLTRRDKLLLLLVLSATLAQRPITINGFGYFLFIIMIYQLAACDTSVTTSRQNV